MPPISCTSKWRWPSVRLAASRQVAKAGTRMSSSVLPSASSFLNCVGARAQRVVGELLQLLFQRVDLVDARAIALDAPFVGGTEQLAGETGEHRGRSFSVPHRAGCGLQPPRCTLRAALFGLHTVGNSKMAPPDGPARNMARDRRGSKPCQSAQNGRFWASNRRALTPLLAPARQSVVANARRLRECPPPIARGHFPVAKDLTP